MRGSWILVVALLAVPLAGCLGGTTVTMFSQWQLPDGSPAPMAVEDCDQLLDILNERTLEETNTLLTQSAKGIGYGGGFRGDVAFMESDDASTADSAGGDGAPAGAAPSAPSARDSEVTGTNNQEDGVDEADVLKTDGEWTYVIQGDHLYVLKSETVGNVSEHARIGLDGEFGGQLLLERRDAEDRSDDRLIVITSGSRPNEDTSDAGHHYYRHEPFTHVRVFDLSDRSDPELVKELEIDGSHTAARLIDGHAYIVAHQQADQLELLTSARPTPDDLEQRNLTWQEFYEMSEKKQTQLRTELADAARKHNVDVLQETTLQDYLPRILERDANGVGTPRLVDEQRCRQFLVTEEATGRSISTILALDATDDGFQYTTTQSLGSRPIVYGALDALVLAAPSRDSWWFWDHQDVDEATDLQWFDLDKLDVRPRASGRVPGIVQDSFGIDVHDGTLRIATTTGQWGRWWVDADEREPMMNHLVILEAEAGELAPTGMVGGIAPGERIWSARFTDTRAYIITFEQIDPLWIIDLTDESDPRILGELEIPGVSTYIHPLSDELLLTIGFGPREEGTGLDWSRIQVSLFDISDESDPKRADVLDISPPDGWSNSGATREHKAFTYWDRLGILAVPLSTHQYGNDQYHRDIGLRLIDVDEENKQLSVRGQVDQDSLLDGMESWYGGVDIQRSYFLGQPDEGIVSVYAMSRLGITVHDLTTLQEQDHVQFATSGGEGHYVID